MKKYLKLFSLLMLFFWAGISHAQEQRISFTEYTLDNGLHVILHQDNFTPNIAVNIMYHVGSKNENPERTGFAHFFEHLMFEGTRHIGRGEFSEIVERAGGTLNAYTSFDVTNYFVLLPSNQLELGLWLESERLLHPVIDSIGIATQKSVVTEEMKQTRDNRPYGRLLIETVSRAFSQHPYQWDVLGADPHIRNASQQEIQDFHDMFYVPNNAVLVITGDIEIDETKKLVEKYFGDIPRSHRPIHRPQVVEPPLQAEIRDTIFDNVQLPMIVQAYRIPAQGTPDFYAVEMLGTLLSQGQSSRMYRRLVNEDQTALMIQAMPLGLEDPGLGIVLAIPNMGIEPHVLEQGMNAELEKVRNELISETELQKLKNQIESQMVSDNTTIARRANNLATYHTLYGNANLINTELDHYLSVTREDIRRVARQYFHQNNRVVLYFMPHVQ